MSKIQRVTVAESTTAQLRRSILRNEIPQGTPLTENNMADELGVSRTTMRQALNTLMLEGLLTREASTRVLQVTTLGVDDVRDIYRARRFLELGGIDAASEASDSQRAQLEQSVRELREASRLGDPAAFVDADFKCHAAIVAFLGSTHLSECHSQLMAKLRLALSQVTSVQQDDLESVLVHEAFTDQILGGQVELARASLAQRLQESEKQVLARIFEQLPT